MKSKVKKIVEDSRQMDDWITQSEAAELRGVSISAISQLVRRGRLRTEERYGKLLVSRSEVMAFEPAPGGYPKGRPRKG